jgi:hypothetical protein
MEQRRIDSLTNRKVLVSMGAERKQVESQEKAVRDPREVGSGPK